jgi:hypothetical protein
MIGGTRGDGVYPTAHHVAQGCAASAAIVAGPPQLALADTDDQQRHAANSRGGAQHRRKRHRLLPLRRLFQGPDVEDLLAV